MRRIFESTAPHLAEFGWGHGRFLDFWSLVHMLTGALLGMVAWGAGLPLAETFLAVISLATLYEVIEILLQVSEDAENVLTDIVLTTIGGALAWYLTALTHPSLIVVAWAFAGILALDAFLFSLGWRHYLKKKLNGG